jgi:hypothetical protein
MCERHDFEGGRGCARGLGARYYRLCALKSFSVLVRFLATFSRTNIGVSQWTFGSIISFGASEIGCYQ